MTGGAGLTGGAVARALVERRAQVVTIVRRLENQLHLPGSVETILGDCRDAQMMERLLAECDVLVHVAGIQLGPALAALPGLRRVDSITVVSSAGVYAQHRSSRAAYRAGEDALRQVRPDVTILRPTMIYGSERDRNVHYVIDFARRYRLLPLFGDGRRLVQPVHYEDLAAAVVAAALHIRGETLDVGGAAPLTVREAALVIFAALGLPPHLIRVPLAPAVVVARVFDGLSGARVAERLERLREDRTVDNRRLVELTGVRPRAFADGVRDQVAQRDGGSHGG